MVVAGRWKNDTGITRNAPDPLRSQVIAPLAMGVYHIIIIQDEISGET